MCTIPGKMNYKEYKVVRTYCMYSQTSLVSTPGDPPNCYSLTVIFANHTD